MSERVSCPPLELHLTHTCNLTCLGCNHYSNYRLENWYITPKQLEEWAEIWSDRVVPSTFNLLGGEPTLHPDLCELLLIATRYFDTGAPDVIGKECPVCLITNGSFLHRHPRLKNILIERRVRLFLSVHYDRRTDIIERVRAWEREGVAVTIYDYAVRKEWRKFYRGAGRNMEPFEDGLPEESWKHCSAKGYFQLFEGKIWKCANIAYLALAKKALGLSQRWDRYLAYQPLESTASRSEMLEFFARNEESICNMCPSRPAIIENVEGE
jgi:Radical SAM superfamily